MQLHCLKLEDIERTAVALDRSIVAETAHKLIITYVTLFSGVIVISFCIISIAN